MPEHRSNLVDGVELLGHVGCSSDEHLVGAECRPRRHRRRRRRPERGSSTSGSPPGASSGCTSRSGSPERRCCRRALGGVEDLVGELLVKADRSAFRRRRSRGRRRLSRFAVDSRAMSAERTTSTSWAGPTTTAAESVSWASRPRCRASIRSSSPWAREKNTCTCSCSAGSRGRGLPRWSTKKR